MPLASRRKLLELAGDLDAEPGWYRHDIAPARNVGLRNGRKCSNAGRDGARLSPTGRKTSRRIAATDGIRAAAQPQWRQQNRRHLDHAAGAVAHPRVGADRAAR